MNIHSSAPTEQNKKEDSQSSEDEEVNEESVHLNSTESEFETSFKCSSSIHSELFSPIESLPHPRPGLTDDKFQQSPLNTGTVMIKTTSVLSSPDMSCLIDLNQLNPVFIHSLGIKYDSFSSGFDQWMQLDTDNHMRLDIIEFISELDDQIFAAYLTDEIYREASGWKDEHGYSIISMIRQSIIDRIINKQTLPLAPFDTTRPNEFIEQSFESVHYGQLSYIRQLKVCFLDDDLNSSNEKKLSNYMNIMKKNSADEQLFFYHGTTEIHARSIIGRGIHLRPRCSRGGDFGFAFYTTNDLVAAMKHAENRAEKTHGAQRPACLAFRIGKDEFDGHEILRLSYDEHAKSVSKQLMDQTLNNNNNVLQWDVFVYRCLNDDPPQPIIDTKDAIIGPISSNLVDITNGYRPIMRTYNRGKSISLQTAIVSIKLVYALFDGLQCVFIWGKKKSNVQDL